MAEGRPLPVGRRVTVGALRRVMPARGGMARATIDEPGVVEPGIPPRDRVVTARALGRVVAFPAVARCTVVQAYVVDPDI